ncbi:ABC transporter substrate-binding protein [Bacterioplanes sanyensis]|uniref:substrate-binding periplasmic protein n=1 Tax=Bacterioplanes sanyensis TaxID=1249553 RepID=UPI001675C9AF|nr:transporter substrate-binding domain-containing protein [Bacterioplanes sanyensis]GGY48115.1 ABC transporter substrate-binding protein [Bacterioplanes sanyensis]
MRQILVCLLLCLATHAGAETVRIAIGEWPPYHDSQAPHAGLASHAIQQAFANQGINVEFSFFPWNRAYKIAASGEFDATAVWYDSEERRQLFHMSDPVMMAQTVFFHRSDREFDWQEYSDLKGMRIGVAQYALTGDGYGKDFSRIHEQGVATLHAAHDDRMLFTMLLHDRIDLFPIDRIAGMGLLEEFSAEQRAQITYHPKPIRQDGGLLLMSKKKSDGPDLVRRFNQGLKQLRAAGGLIELGLPPEDSM